MSSFSLERTVLPKRAPRAKARFDRLSFREPGDLSATQRKEKLEDKVTKLREEEDVLKRRLEEMRNKYLSRIEVEEVERSLVHINMKMKDMTESTKGLYDRLVSQVNDTKQALVQALAPRGTVDQGGRLASKELKRKKKALGQRRRDLQLATLKARILDDDIKKLDKSIIRCRVLQQQIRELLDTPDDQHGENISDDESDGSVFFLGSDSSDEASELSEPEMETQAAKIPIEGESLGRLTSLGGDGIEESRDAQEEPTKQITAVDAAAESDTAQPMEPAMATSTQQQKDQTEEIEDLENKKVEDSISTEITHGKPDDKKLVSDNGEHEDQGKVQIEAGANDNTNMNAPTERVEQPTTGEDMEARKNQEIKAEKQRKMRARLQRQRRSRLNDLEREIEENEKELSEKKAEKERRTEECDNLRRGVIRLDQDTKTMIRSEEEKERHLADNENDRQWQEKKREDQRLEVEDMERQKNREVALDAVRKDSSLSNRSRLRRQISWRYFISTENESESDNEGKQLQSLSKVIDEVEALEERIRNVRRLNETVDSVVDLRIVLERELELERKWLSKQDKQATASASTEDSLMTVARDHFSSSLPSELIDSYEPLEENQVRLLVLWPATADHYPLLCTLKTATWGQGTSNPQYAALSYFWGSDDCNGRLYLVRPDDQTGSEDQSTWGSTARYAVRIPIRNNLFRALLRLRRSDRPVSLWIDVICINQTDSAEKTNQLEQMINIYRNAENVCVWLGESDNKGRSDEAMDFITTIMDFAVLDRYAQDNKQAKKWYGLAELMRDRWFSRRWVVQEISLAREATVHCGNKMVQWPDFADAVSLLASNQDTIRNLFDHSEWRDGPSTLGDVQSFGAYILLEATSKLFLRTAQGQITRPIKKLESLVTSLKTFDATDPRDLIYSLVSIASDTPQGQRIYSGKQAVVPLVVDYAKLPLTVYEDFTKFCILSSMSLDVLCRPWAMTPRITGADSKVITLPSWIPLLSRSEFGDPEDVYSGRKNGENLVGPVDRSRYKASAGTRYDIQLADEKFGDSQFLPVTGFKLAKINKISSRITGGVILRDSLKMGGWTGISEDTASVPDKIWRTLVADRDPEGQIPPTWYQRACLRCLEIADTFNNGDLNVGEILTGNSELIRKYLTRVRNVTWNRRFFEASMSGKPRHTEAEHVPNGTQEQFTNDYGSDSHNTDGETEFQTLFGLGPPNMLEGDYICILDGCSVPVVLREQMENESMELIGETYVHGKMEGEAMEDLENGITCGKRANIKLK
ncbi:heterokaryon incompatibility protein-domain-containing protein [Nemania sp. NC0429]|nr:heterokaryon incompatibility protein-domain-containing protein [Nemania sp. NC0429]